MSPGDLDAALADFRRWLEGAASAGTLPEPPAEESAPVDLHTLVAQFTALRHEINLQTKAARGQQEQNAEALQTLSQALTTLRQAQEKADAGDEESDDDELLRPLLKTLVDAFDALSLAEREIRRVQDNVLPQLDRLVGNVEAAARDIPDLPPAVHPPEPTAERPVTFWDRLFGPPPRIDGDPFAGERQSLAAAHRELSALRQALSVQRNGQLDPARQAAEQIRQAFASVVTGYTMSRQRIERALTQHGLEPIPAAGQPFDPEQMEVVGVATDSGRPAGEVVEEVRRGYRWRGRIFRYAQVSVAKA